MFDAMDVGMLSFIIPSTKNGLNQLADKSAGFGSVNSIGMAIGALFLGIWADK